MCAIVFDSPDAQDSAPVYHFPNQYKMAQRGDMFYFQNKTASSAEVRVRGGSLAGQPSSIYNFLRDFLSHVQIAADTLVILYNSNSGVRWLKSWDTLGESLVWLLTCDT